MKTYRYKNIIEGTAENDSKAIKDLYQQLLDETGEIIRSHVLNNNGTKEDFEDLSQEAFFKFVIRTKDRRFMYAYDQALIAFYVKFTKGLWRDQLRKNQRRNGDIDKEPPKPDDFDFFQQFENEDFFEKLWQKIGEECKKLLIFWYWYGMKAPEVKEEMSYTSDRAVHDKKYSCIQKLRTAAFSLSNI